MQRSGDWNSKNRELWEETQRLGGNKYREIYLKLTMNQCKKCGKPVAYMVEVCDNCKKCTCGDTETQHYENTDKCVVCGCKEFEEAED